MVEYVYDNAGTLTATSDYVADAGLKAEAEQLFNTTYADLAEAKAALLANNKCAFQNGTTYSLS